MKAPRPQSDKLAFSVPEAASAASVSKSTIKVAIKDRRLPARKLGGRTLIMRDDLLAFLRGLPSAGNGC